MLISWVLRDLISSFLEIDSDKSLGTCQKLSGRDRGWKQREGHNFLRLRKGRGHEKWAVKRGRVMQICVLDHVEVHPQKKKEVLYFVKKTWEK